MCGRSLVCSGALQSQELCEAQKEMTALRRRISEREMEREQAYKEAQDLQQQMAAKQVSRLALLSPNLWSILLWH